MNLPNIKLNTITRLASRFAVPFAWLVLATWLKLEPVAIQPPAKPSGAGQIHTTYWVVAHPQASVSLSAAALVFAAAYALMSLGRTRVRQGLGWAQLALATAGGLLIFSPQLWLLARRAPQRCEDLPATVETASRLSTIGYLVEAISLTVFLAALADWLVHRLRRRRTRP